MILELQSMLVWISEIQNKQLQNLEMLDVFSLINFIIYSTMEERVP